MYNMVLLQINFSSCAVGRFLASFFNNRSRPLLVPRSDAVMSNHLKKSSKLVGLISGAHFHLGKARASSILVG